MRYTQLFENRDYSIALKQFQKLSDGAQTLLKNWEKHGQRGLPTEKSSLNDEFENHTPLSREIWNIGQPIRDNIRQREGDSIILYRGIVHEYNQAPERLLFSWTSVEKTAKFFAGQRNNKLYKNTKHITKQEVRNAIQKYHKNGFLNFHGYRYIKNRNNPDYFSVYIGKTKYVHPEEVFQDYIKKQAARNNEYYIHPDEFPGEIFSKSIPVDDIVWVLMGPNLQVIVENEYIVKGHAQ